MAPTGKELHILRQQGVEWPEIYELFPDAKPATLRKRLSRYLLKNPRITQNGKTTVRGEHPGRIASVPALYRAFEIQSDEYELKHVKINTWEQHSVAKGYKTLYQISANISPRPDKEAEQRIEALREELRDTPVYQPVPPQRHTSKANKLITFNLPDLHLGKQADTPYEPEDYNLETAINTYCNALKHLLRQTKHYKAQEVWLPTGNDLIHIDTIAGTTTAGTPVSPNASLKKLWTTAHNLIRYAINLIAKKQRAAKIVVPLVPGNHDSMAVYTLGMALSDLYANDPRVHVIPADQPRAYLRYGNTLIGFHHGHKIKPNDLAHAMPAEAPVPFSITKMHEWHLGHYHQARNTQLTTLAENHAIVFRVLPSLSAPDTWHHERAYHSNRSAVALVYDHDTGHQSSHYYRYT